MLFGECMMNVCSSLNLCSSTQVTLLLKYDVWMYESVLLCD